MQNVDVVKDAVQTGDALFGTVDTRGCIWFEDKGGWDMVIHGFWDMDIHFICLVGRMGRAIFLFG
jgi:hypothetical protein